MKIVLFDSYGRYGELEAALAALPGISVVNVFDAGLLRAAGVAFMVEPAAIDEASLKVEARHAGDSAVSCAIALAIEKACNISRRHPDALVIGADQLLAADNEWFDKPRDLAEARAQLLGLRGRTHVLATAVCVARSGSPLWRATSMPELMMRRRPQRPR